MSLETLKTEKQREQILKKTEQNIQILWDNYKRCNTYVKRIPEEEKETEEISEAIMTEKFPKLVSDTKPQIQELREHQAYKCYP